MTCIERPENNNIKYNNIEFIVSMIKKRKRTNIYQNDDSQQQQLSKKNNSENNNKCIKIIRNSNIFTLIYKNLNL